MHVFEYLSVFLFGFRVLLFKDAFALTFIMV